MDGEEPILFQAMVPGDAKMRNAWFILRTIKTAIFEIFDDVPPPLDTESIGNDLLGINSAIVGCFLYTVGGQVPNEFELSNRIRWLDINSRKWAIDTLPFSCADSVIGVYDDCLHILPGVWKFGCYGVDKDRYLSTRPMYVWDIREEKCGVIERPPPTFSGKRQWGRIRACAALDGEGLLIAMDGEENNFFLYNPKENDWEICQFKDPLPKFMGETSFAASNGRLYILEVLGKSPAFLYIYNIKERNLVMNKEPLEFDDDLWSMDKWDRVVRLVPVADDKLCFLWLGPVSYENKNTWPPVRNLHYVKVKFYFGSNPMVKVVDNKVFRTNISSLFDCLPCDPKQFGAEVRGKSPLYLTLDADHKQKDKFSVEAIGTSFQCVDQLLKQSPSETNLRNCEVQINLNSKDSKEESVVRFKLEPTTKYEEHPATINLEGKSISLGRRSFSFNSAEVPRSISVGQRTGTINFGDESSGDSNNDDRVDVGAGGINVSAAAGSRNSGEWTGTINFTVGPVSIDFRKDLPSSPRTLSQTPKSNPINHELQTTE